jgi:hypothetical protein
MIVIHIDKICGISIVRYNVLQQACNAVESRYLLVPERLL